MNKTKGELNSRPITNQVRSRLKSQGGDREVVFDTTDVRFKDKGMNSYVHQGGTNMNIGPGSYVNRDNSFLKKSFNMSVEQRYLPV